MFGLQQGGGIFFGLRQGAGFIFDAETYKPPAPQAVNSEPSLIPDIFHMTPS